MEMLKDIRIPFLFLLNLLTIHYIEQSESYDCDYPNLPMENGMYVIPNAKPQYRDDDYAIGTTPKGFSVRLSTIPNAGLGVFAETAIPKNTRLGPYEGIIYDYQDPEKDWTYSWSVSYSPYYSNESKHHVDAMEKAHSSWLRYINMPNTIDQENLYVYQLNYEIYYVTYECIKPGTELMVWYGETYGKYLGLNRTSEDYMRRFNEPFLRSEYENHLPIGPPIRIKHNCYMFTHQCSAEKPVSSPDGYVKLCMPGTAYDVCKYWKCDKNPCTRKADCRECPGFCFHMGYYVKPNQSYSHADEVNGCVCKSDGTPVCSNEAWSYEDMCVY